MKLNMIEASKIYTAYRNFYNKEPILNRDNIRILTIEIQSMIYLLQEYDVKLGNFGFIKYGYRDMNIPMSMNAQKVITIDMMNKNYNFDETIMTKKDNNKIKFIGEIVEKEINKTDSKIETLRSIALISYYKKHIKPERSDEEVIRLTGYTKEDIDREKRIDETIKSFDNKKTKKLINKKI